VPPPLAVTVGERPVASPLARWQATRRDQLTNLRHEVVRISDATAREVLTLLDGSRGRGQLADALGPGFARHDRRTVAALVDRYLQGFARAALLLGP
jgi:hypothetical protein